jgi:hypothetical protein
MVNEELSGDDNRHRKKDHLGRKTDQDQWSKEEPNNQIIKPRQPESSRNIKFLRAVVNMVIRPKDRNEMRTPVPEVIAEIGQEQTNEKITPRVFEPEVLEPGAPDHSSPGEIYN